MKRTAIKPSEKPMKRSRINPVSAKRRETAADRDLVREAVFARDNYRCVLRDWHHSALVHTSVLTVHHIKKTSARGPYEVANLVSLCASCNDWVEMEPTAAHALGLVCRNGDTLDECWARMRAVGLVQ